MKKEIILIKESKEDQVLTITVKAEDEELTEELYDKLINTIRYNSNYSLYKIENEEEKEDRLKVKLSNAANNLF